MRNIHFMKLGGIMAFICFLFLPVAGCGPLTISGIDLLKMSDISVTVKLFAVLAMLCAIAIIFLPNKSYVLFAAMGGLISLVIVYLLAKTKMSSGNDMGMTDAVELKSGSYLSVLGFIVAAVVSKLKNEILNTQLPPTPPSSEDKEK